MGYKVRARRSPGSIIGPRCAKPGVAERNSIRDLFRYFSLLYVFLQHSVSGEDGGRAACRPSPISTEEDARVGFYPYRCVAGRALRRLGKLAVLLRYRHQNCESCPRLAGLFIFAHALALYRTSKFSDDSVAYR